MEFGQNISKKSPARIDWEQEIAQKLSALWGMFNDPYHQDFEKFLLWLLENHSKLQNKANETLLKCLTDIDSIEGPITFNEIMNAEDYSPKERENFGNYIKRLRI